MSGNCSLYTYEVNGRTPYSLMVLCMYWGTYLNKTPTNLKHVLIFLKHKFSKAYTVYIQESVYIDNLIQIHG